MKGITVRWSFPLYAGCWLLWLGDLGSFLGQIRADPTGATRFNLVLCRNVTCPRSLSRVNIWQKTSFGSEIFWKLILDIKKVNRGLWEVWIIKGTFDTRRCSKRHTWFVNEFNLTVLNIEQEYISYIMVTWAREPLQMLINGRHEGFAMNGVAIRAMMISHPCPIKFQTIFCGAFWAKLSSLIRPD
jgi:hypothetical protein